MSYLSASLAPQGFLESMYVAWSTLMDSHKNTAQQNTASFVAGHVGYITLPHIL